ncbi:hypothetical protein GALL_487380 [mine drainage metagenome]|uniref:Uncharacterized protein n=1 Tax=mine drainage metagenome TaxID=410659 RepID=A0A1J5PQ06_9ZZZZ
MLGLLVVEPVLPPPVIAVLPLLPRTRKPVRPLPARNLAKHRAALLQMLVQRRASHPARGFHLPVGVVVGIKQPQRFSHPLLQIAPVALERLRAANIDLPQVKRRLAIIDPLRQGHARAARRHDPDRVIPRRDPIPFQLRRLAQIIAIIGGKAFRPVKEGMNPRRLEHRHPPHRRLKDRLEMVEILGQ